MEDKKQEFKFLTAADRKIIREMRAAIRKEQQRAAYLLKSKIEALVRRYRSEQQ